ncbi:uncharacterized protein J4E79_006189 [Alternaria viburni]|uniref:uncharacterized protein n=1 Tax=Alternaria viburni TaxID=566460 RepID=UPI0020C3ACEA|nr:uncharacterized protein J4E79_006189 [Alternaria viburni]KAI4659654.1 hypothetical protein J4E79_006189 [Alternaria viburni]
MPMSKIPRQLLLPGGKRVIDERYAEHRHRLIGMLRDYLSVLRASPQIFYAYREVTWSRFCAKISLPTFYDGLTIITDDPKKLGRKNGWFADFPQQYFVGNPEAKSKVLVISPCYDIGVLKKLIEQLFAGLDVDIDEVKVRLKTPKEKSITATDEPFDFENPNPTVYIHWCMRVTHRPTGKQTSLDISGVQYGMIQGDMPWQPHTDIFVDEVQAIKPLGTLAKYADEVSQTKGTEGLRFEVAASAMKAWHETVDAAMERKGLAWADVLGKEEEAFQRHTKKILSVGTKAMQKYAAETKLTKKRLKAERYEQRHEDWLMGELKELERLYLE